jgi:hypothetical protein
MRIHCDFLFPFEPHHPLLAGGIQWPMAITALPGTPCDSKTFYYAGAGQKLAYKNVLLLRQASLALSRGMI